MAVGLWSAQAQPTVTTVATNGLHEPHSVAVDGFNNYFLTDSANNRIVRVDGESFDVTEFSGRSGMDGYVDGSAYDARFFGPEGVVPVSFGTTNGLLVADTGNHCLRLVNFLDGSVVTLAGTNIQGLAVAGSVNGSAARFRSPVGLGKGVGTNSSRVYIADSKNNAIRSIDLNDPNLTVHTLAVTGTTFFEPRAVIARNEGQLWVADTRNNVIKLIDIVTPTSGNLNLVLGDEDPLAPGSSDAAVQAGIRFNSPNGLLWIDPVDGPLIVSDTQNQTLRVVTNNVAFGPNVYGSATLGGVPGEPGNVDGTLATVARFNGPRGLALDFGGGVLVVDLAGSSLRRIQFADPQPPVSNPRIGYVELIFNELRGAFETKLFEVQNETFNNDITIAIDPVESSVETFYTSGATPVSPFNDKIDAPSSATGPTPTPYEDGMSALPTPNLLDLVQRFTSFTIKARSFDSGRIASDITQAQFNFKVGNPVVNGNNAASFFLTNVTTGAEMWYTFFPASTNGPAPTNGGPFRLYTGGSLSLEITEDTVFLVRAYKNGYQPSGVISNLFSVTNFNANRLTWGFDSGEASSEFFGSPGQKFFAPITLTILPGTELYSFQFNMSLTNEVGPAVDGSTIEFTSMLMDRVPNLPHRRIPPSMAANDITSTNAIPTNPPPASKYLDYDGITLLDLQDLDSVQKLLSVAWLERKDATSIPTLFGVDQNLISDSIAHDTLFTTDGGGTKVVVGTLAFKVPSTAVLGNSYDIVLNRPSATTDGIGAPGSDVLIQVPTDGSLTNGAVNSIKRVRIANRSYIVGDVAPFRWLNAGDFGNGSIKNDDVMQIFQSAIFNLSVPPSNSDLFQAMDSCCLTGVTNPGTGVFTASAALTAGQKNTLYSGNDQTVIDSVMFGDGVLDVNDVYVTFRRSLNSKLKWYRRYWTNLGAGSVLVAQTTSNVFQGAPSANTPAPVLSNFSAPLGTNFFATFEAGDAVVTDGSVAQVPIYVHLGGGLPLNVLTLALAVKPVDNAPDLTSAISFQPSSTVDSPSVNLGPIRNSLYAAAWFGLNLTGELFLGTLSIPIPAGAGDDATYVVDFMNQSVVSGTSTGYGNERLIRGIVSLGDRSGSSKGDGIPDAWKLRHFGNNWRNLLADATADADGDGVNNLREFLAGTDPNDVRDLLKTLARRTARQGNSEVSIEWPSILGKFYKIEGSSSLFEGSWGVVSGPDAIAGTGGLLQWTDPGTGNQPKFYRVVVVE